MSQTEAVARVYVRKRDDVWTWSCPTCRYDCWTRLGFPRALAEATRHQLVADWGHPAPCVV